MDRHCANAQSVAEFLDARPEVTEVLYPGLESHPGHEIAARQGTGKGFGGMISVRFGSEEKALAFAKQRSSFVWLNPLAEWKACWSTLLR